MYKYRSTYKLISSFLLVLILSINIGFSVDIHYCQGSIADMTFYGDAHSCGEIISENGFCNMRVEIPTPANSNQVNLKSLNTCCSDFLFSVQIEEDTNISHLDELINTSSIELLTFIPTVPISSIFELQILPSEIIEFDNYLSPFIPKDISVLLDRFLI